MVWGLVGFRYLLKKRKVSWMWTLLAADFPDNWGCLQMNSDPPNISTGAWNCFRFYVHKFFPPFLSRCEIFLLGASNPCETPGRYRHESENLIFLEHQRAAAYGLYATFYNGLTEGIKVLGWGGESDGNYQLWMGPHLEDHPRTSKWLVTPPFISHKSAIWKGSHNST